MLRRGRKTNRDNRTNPDVLIDDLKRKCASNESLWLIGQADVKLKSG